MTTFRFLYWCCSNVARGNRNSDATTIAGAGSNLCGVFKKA